MASHVPKPVNINRADESELKSLLQIGRFWAQAIIAAHTDRGGRLMEDDFKAIPKLGAEVWQLLLDKDAITFGSPAPVPTDRHEPKSMSSASSADDTQNQMESSADTTVGPPTQSTPVHIAQAHFQFQPQYQKALASAPQSSANGDNLTPGLGNPPQGSADEALSWEQMAAEITQLRQQLKFTEETLEDVQDHHGSEMWSYQGELESLKEDKGKIEKIGGELQAKQEGSRVNLMDTHCQVNQLEQANAQLEAYNQDLEEKYWGLKRSWPPAKLAPHNKPLNPRDTPSQSLHKVIVAKPETGVVKPEVSTPGGSMLDKPSSGPVTQVIKA